MLTETQTQRMLDKLNRFAEMINPLLFIKKAEIGAYAYKTFDRLNEIPDMSLFEPAEKGWNWGEERVFCWFRTEFTVPDELDGQDLFIMPHFKGYEALLWVDGEPYGIFTNKITFIGRGNHYCDLLRKNAKAGDRIEIAIEVYAGHDHKGCAPYDAGQHLDYNYIFNGIDICVKDYEMNEFCFDLVAVNDLAKALKKDSFRRGDVINALYEVHKRVYYSYEDTDEETFRNSLREAHPFLKEILAVKSGPEAPFTGIIGHSHLDTAWLWPVAESVKKCARTFSNQLALMEQYPEYKFVQSSAAHLDMMLKYYPSLFRRIQTAVAQGKYEPNGAVWVECDCNITSGESMIRQFLWGQRFTREHFGFTSNTFWLPDTFGYSAAIPQIMKGCGVDYFCTTKIDWNDTNSFPYDTFVWQGIDGTKVFTHFNRIHLFPSPNDIIRISASDAPEGIKERSVTRKRLLTYGFGDGGGGPQFEMLEMSRRSADLNGSGKSAHMFVGDFMKLLEADAKNPSTYSGELYLELHRGTLTNQHNIKRNNRKAELALRDLEYLTVNNSVRSGVAATGDKIHPLYEKLLLNQFHDILPGTCIPEVHALSIEETSRVIDTAKELISDAVSDEGDCITLINTLSFDRSDPVFVECEEGMIADCKCKQQSYKNLDGKNVLIISGITVPAFSSVKINLIKGEATGESEISLSGNKLSTPFADITFDDRGRMSSFIDKRMNRELCGEGYALNSFLVAEDFPKAWDNWDIDADIECKYHDDSVLLSREVISQGAAATVIRSRYCVAQKSVITQDAFFFADSAEIRFDTLMDWQNDHRFLKAAFDTSLRSDYARFEIQFGNVLRPTTRNDSVEKAKFEVVNHKYTDLSETRCGAAVLNDSKYAISVEGGKMRLSLHKGGKKPDYNGDKGLHRTVYSFLPHTGAFSAEAVIKPAYELNIPVVTGKGEYESTAFIVPKADNVIVECVKPCEDSEKAFIVRLYEAEGTYTNCPVEIFEGAKKVEITNMLEEVQSEFTADELVFNPFEIKTLKISY